MGRMPAQPIGVIIVICSALVVAIMTIVPGSPLSDGTTAAGRDGVTRAAEVIRGHRNLSLHEPVNCL